MTRPNLRTTAAAVVAAVVALIGPPAAQATVPVPVVGDYGPAIDALAGYEPPLVCRATTQPGVAQVADLLRRTYPDQAVIDAVRPCPPDGKATSEHHEGRAIDFMVRVSDGGERAIADALIGWLLATDRYGNSFAMARRLGVMYLIWDHRLWSAYTRTWTDYTGSSPHTDHIHVSFSWAAAAAQTSFFTGYAVSSCDQDDPDCPLRRLAGADRYATSVAAGRAAFPFSHTVVVASGESAHLVDGLVAAPLAFRLRAPLLLAKAAGLPGQVALDLVRRRASTAYVVGGKGSLSAAVVTDLRRAGVARVLRVQGADRYETAAAVAHLVGRRGAAIVASGRESNLADALAAGGPAGRAGRPVLLTAPTVLPRATARALRDLRVAATLVVGGKAAVSAAVSSHLPRPTRAAGKDRYATAAAVATALGSAVGTSEVVVAAGATANMVDALPGGALGRLTLLTATTTIAGPAGSWLRASASTRAATVLGGVGAVSPRAAGQLTALLLTR